MNLKLRPVHSHPLIHQGQPAIMLRDPLRLTDQVIILPQALIPMLTLLDGERDLDGLQASLMIRAGLNISREDLAHIVDQLDQALLLHSPRFLEVSQTALDAYRRAPQRQPSSAGASYPADPDALRALLDGYLADIPPTTPWSQGRGLISPHIDYERGGTVYAQVWARAAEFVRQAELAIILGTDHNGSDGQLTLTRQHYATPYGLLPTAVEVVDGVAEAIGEAFAFEEELHHLGEHSIELAAVWLQHIRGGEPIEIVPILCGSFQHFILTPFEPDQDERLNQALDVLRQVAAERPTVVIAAADLAHVGPAFGGATPIDFFGRAQLVADDNRLITSVCTGDAQGFYRQIEAEQDQRNVCGLAPIYLTLRLLGETRGESAGYDRCPADNQGASWVTICGVVLE